MATTSATPRSVHPALSRSAPPLIAAGSVVLLLGAVAWWLAVDRQVPDFDSGKHLLSTWSYSDSLRAGDLTEPFTAFTQYPPVVHAVGAIGSLVGGVNVAAPILATALVFVPLMALGLYRAGVSIGDRWTGALAVLFALGAPMILTEFRAFMLEPGMTALLALTVWLLLDSRRFERTGLAALAGAATGVGLMTKQSFAFFVAGFIAVLILRGGWRNPRGLIAFAGVALAIAAPWYITHWDDLRATSDWVRGPNTAGPIWSAENLSFYVWNTLNRQLLLPLTLFAAVGAVVSTVRFAKSRDRDDYTPEFLAGVVVAWVALTFYLHLKGQYYTLPLTVYAALLATGWMAHIRRRALAGGALALVAVVNFAIAAAWIGDPVRVALPTAKEQPGVVYSRNLTLVSPVAWPHTLPPGEHGDVLALMRRLEARGIEVVEFDPGTDLAYFNGTGLTAFARLAGLTRPPAYDPAALKPPTDAFMGRQFIEPGQPPVCVDLGDGSGVFVTLGSPFDHRRICPGGP